MNKVFLFLVVIFMGCDKEIRIEKRYTESKSDNEIYEIYLVSNFPEKVAKRDSLFSSFSKKRIEEILEKDTLVVSLVREDSSKVIKIDSLINTIGIVFYPNSSCVKQYFNNYRYLKGAEAIYFYCDHMQGDYYRYEGL